MGSQSFSATGSAQSFVVPAGVTSIDVDMSGAQGGAAQGSPAVVGGKGGRIQATIVVTPGETLQINVGTVGTDGAASSSTKAGGFNGGGTGGAGIPEDGGGGGGATDIRQGGTALSNRILVAG